MISKQAFYDVNPTATSTDVDHTAVIAERVSDTNDSVSVSTEVISASQQPVAEHNAKSNVPPLATKPTQGDNIMAEVDTAMLSGQHSDIRREQADNTHFLSKQMGDNAGNIRREAAEHAFALGTQMGVQHADIIKEDMRNAYNVRGDIKDTSYETTSRVENSADRLAKQANDFYIAGQTNDNIAQRDLATLTTLQYGARSETLAAIQSGIDRNASVVALEGLKTANSISQGQFTLAAEMARQNEKTRDLINEHKYHDLNRALVERNAELVEERCYGRHWRHAAEQNQFGSQFAQLQSMMQNFGSQLNDTRQGMVNLGTMSGVGQTSTNNNI